MNGGIRGGRDRQIGALLYSGQKSGVRTIRSKYVVNKMELGLEKVKRIANN